MDFFVKEIICRKASYKNIPICISVFYEDGISSDLAKTFEERHLFWCRNFPSAITENLEELKEVHRYPFYKYMKLAFSYARQIKRKLHN